MLADRVIRFLLSSIAGCANLLEIAVISENPAFEFVTNPTAFVGYSRDQHTQNIHLTYMSARFHHIEIQLKDINACGNIPSTFPVPLPLATLRPYTPSLLKYGWQTQNTYLNRMRYGAYILGIENIRSVTKLLLHHISNSFQSTINDILARRFRNYIFLCNRSF